MLRYSTLIWILFFTFAKCEGGDGQGDSLKNVTICNPNFNFKSVQSYNIYADLRYMHFFKWGIGAYFGGGYGYYSSIYTNQNKTEYAVGINNFEVGITYKTPIRKGIYNLASIGYYQLNYYTKYADDPFSYYNYSFNGLKISDLLLIPVGKHFSANTEIGYSQSKAMGMYYDYYSHNPINSNTFAKKIYFQIGLSYSF